MTIDILIEQYDPVKLHNLRSHQENAQQRADSVLIARSLDEIKNAEKQLKNSQKELGSITKKYNKVKDFKYLSNLLKSCEEDNKKIEQLEKDNRKLQTEAKKAEMKLNRKMRGNLDGEIQHKELIELDNTIQVLQQKQQYIEDKLAKEQLEEQVQIEKLASLKQ